MTSRKILLFGANDNGNLQMCRLLGRAGHCVIVLRLSPQKTLADYSRYCSESIYIGSPSLGVREYLAKLQNLLVSKRFDYLIATCSLSCELVYYDYHAIVSLACVLGPTPESYKKIRNYHESLSVAESAGMVVPVTMLLQQSGHLPDARFPCLVKSVYSTAIIDDELQSFSERRVNNINELDNKLRDDLSRADVMLQTLTEGARVDLVFCATEGHVLGASVILHLHEAYRMGESTYKITETVNSSTIMMIKKIARKLSYTGYGTIECRKKDDQHLVFLKMKCWPTESLLLSSFAGCDIANLIIDNLEGKKSSKIVIPVKTVYSRHLARDIIWLLTQLKRKKGIKVLFDWLRSFMRMFTGYEIYEIEHHNDFLPALHQFDNLIQSIVNKLRLRLTSFFVDTQVPELTLASLTKKSSILIVCKGNINRSLVAEQLLKANGFTCVQSAGLLPMTGRRPSRQAEQFLSTRLNIKNGNLRSQSIFHAMKNISHVDFALCFERIQIVEILERFPELRNRVHLITRVTDEVKNNLEIPDPHGGNAEAYQTCFVAIEKCVEHISKVASNNQQPI